MTGSEQRLPTLMLISVAILHPKSLFTCHETPILFFQKAVYHFTTHCDQSGTYTLAEKEAVISVKSTTSHTAPDLIQSPKSVRNETKDLPEAQPSGCGKVASHILGRGFLDRDRRWLNLRKTRPVDDLPDSTSISSVDSFRPLRYTQMTDISSSSSKFTRG